MSIDTPVQYRAWLWAQVKTNKITIEQLAATDDKTSALLPMGHVLVKAANWARGEMQKKNALLVMAEANKKVTTKRTRKTK